MNGHLLGGGLYRKKGQYGEENRYSEVCVKTDQTNEFTGKNNVSF